MVLSSGSREPYSPSSSPPLREAAAPAGRLGPGDRLGGRDVPGPQGALLRVVGHVRALARVFVRRAHVDQRLVAEGGQHVVLERADRPVITLHDGITGRS